MTEAESMLELVEILARILHTRRPMVPPDPMDDGVSPPAHVPATIRTCPCARSVHAIQVPTADVLRTVWPRVDSVALLPTSPELTLEDHAFLPCFDAHAILQVQAPLALVGEHTRLAVDAPTSCHALPPLTNVRVAIRIQEPPIALGEVSMPLALVDRAIWPPLYSEAVPHRPLPLSAVFCTSGH
eukprot:CAMPEP_0115378816 /NCGR_PEP_ID=MMETSP0271-20121206/4211_1 /TAXON_ID=71861 /ORGANISM="Scrippsiella trochoidea, Strain CCMP3099" /LENGTH=184 /DNA_ID=CAMNT_0002801999 /DNA_START=250 /DNA_END=805 /DNA_ORIENTATION=+